MGEGNSELSNRVNKGLEWATRNSESNGEWRKYTIERAHGVAKRIINSKHNKPHSGT